MITVTRANNIITRCNLNNILILFILILVFLRSSPPKVLLGGGVLKTSSKLIKHPYQGPCQNRTLAWVLSCKCAAYFQNTFSYPKYTSEGLLLILPISGMNYPLIHGIKISFLLGLFYLIGNVTYITYYYSIIYLLYCMLIKN